MESPNGIVCPECGGFNDPSSRFCWFCGSRLRGRWLFRSARRESGRLKRAAKWVVLAIVVVAVLVGTYYALSYFLRPVFQDDEDQAVIVTTATTFTRSSTTTTTTPRTDRLVKGGTDRYGTAIAVSTLGFPDGAPALVLTSGENFAEALSVTPLAVAYGGPVLLVPPDGIRADLSTEIQRLDPAQVFLVGVTRPSRVTNQLEEILAEPVVTRLAGDTPYETAALVAKEIKAKTGDVSKVVIAPSDSFVEAIAVAPLAAAKGWPILLCPEDGDLPAATREAIDDLGVTSAVVVGLDIELALTDVERHVGGDSYETAALIVQYAATQGSRFAHTAIVSGESFPDGLVAGAYLALDKGVLLLAKDGRLPKVMLTLFTANQESIRSLDFIALPSLAKEMASPGNGAGQTETSETGTD